MAIEQVTTTEYIRKMRGLFASIELLGHEVENSDGEVVALAMIGTEFADLALEPERLAALNTNTKEKNVNLRRQALAELAGADANKNGALATLMDVQGTAIDDLFGLRALAFAGMAIGEDAIGECAGSDTPDTLGDALETMVRLLKKIADDADRTISKIDILPAKEEVEHV